MKTTADDREHRILNRLT